MNSLTYHLVFHPTPPPSLSTNHQHTVRHEHECLLHSITCLLLYFRPHGSLCTSYIECLAQTNRSAHKRTHGHTHTGRCYSSLGQSRSSSRSHDSLIYIQTHYRVDDLMTPGRAGDTGSVFVRTSVCMHENR